MLHTLVSVPFQSGESEILLEDGSRSIFYYVQLLHTSQHRADRLRRVWDNTYTLVYQDRHSSASRVSAASTLGPHTPASPALPSFPSQGWSVQFVSRNLGTERLPKGELVQYLQKRAKVGLHGYSKFSIYQCAA